MNLIDLVYAKYVMLCSTLYIPSWSRQSLLCTYEVNYEISFSLGSYQVYTGLNILGMCEVCYIVLDFVQTKSISA